MRHFMDMENFFHDSNRNKKILDTYITQQLQFFRFQHIFHVDWMENLPSLLKE